MSSTQAHPLVRLDFLVRLFACPMLAMVCLVTRLSAGDPVPPVLWAGLLFYALAWPHLEYAFSRRSADPETELRLLNVDAAAVGCAIALTYFRPAPTICLLTAVTTFLSSVGGFPLFFRGMAALGSGAALTSVFVTGMTVAPTTPILAEVFAAVGLLGFQTSMGFFTFRTTSSFAANRRRLAQQAVEIRRQNEELVVARENALEAARARSAFLATMSHEIRTPLNGVLGMTRLLSETPLSAEQHDLLRTVQVSGDTLVTVINDVLDYSRVESGRLELEEEPLNVMQVVEESLDIVADRARTKGIELVCDATDAAPVTILGDATRLRQVVTNLVGNAVKFTEQGEVVVAIRQSRLGTDAEPAELTISVRDTGIGIPEDRIPMLFNAFSQADASTTRKYGGSGLGLAISKRLIGLMGGTISVESTPGVGSTFTFTIRGRIAPSPPPRRVPEVVTGKRVLVVDDNATNRHALCGQLELWGFATSAAAGATEALQALQDSAAFDLAILDYHMPSVDGMTLAREIRATRDSETLPMILLSSSLVQAKDDPQRFFSARLLKPARQSSLFDAIMVAFGAAADGRSASTSAKGGNVDLVALRILVADDNEINRDIARLVLRRFGHQADFVGNGREAVEQVVRELTKSREESYDLVLMDVHMPEMDGLEATRAIRQMQSEQPTQKWPRIVAMTANAMHEDRATCLAAGMEDYLTKPLDFEEVGRVLGVAAALAIDAPPLSVAHEKEAVPAEIAQSPQAVDWSRLDELAEYDTPEKTLVRGAIAALADQAPVALEEIRRSVGENDGAALRAAAHKLKGAASNIGATAVAEVAARLESAGKSVSFGNADALVEDLSTVLETTLGELRRYASDAAS